MGYVAFTSAEVQVGRPTNSSQMTKIKDNFDYFYSLSAGGGNISNGGFEIDTDSDDLPDNWTVSLFAGGAASVTTVTSYVANGHYALNFTHPGGAGNGGGQAQSDYVECSSNNPCFVIFNLMSSPANCRSKVAIEFFDKDKTTVAGMATVLDSSALPTVYTRYQRSFIPPAGAKYFTVNLIGGTTESTVAGSVFFDAIDYAPVMGRAWIPYQSENGSTFLANPGHISLTFDSLTHPIVTEGTAAVFTLRIGGNYRLSYDVKAELGTVAFHSVKKNATVLFTTRCATTGAYYPYSVDATQCVPGDVICFYAATGAIFTIKNIAISSTDNGLVYSTVA